MIRATTVAAFFALVAVPLRGDVPHWVRTAAANAPARVAEEAGVVLLDATSLSVTAKGEITTRHRRAMKVFTAAGRDLAYTVVSFDNDTKLRSLRGWSIDSSGRERDARERNAVETTFDGELYSDTRLKVLRVPGTEIGSVVAFEWERSERPYVLETSWHFQEEMPVQTARFELTLPRDWTYTSRWNNYDPVAPVVAGPASVWELRSIAAISDEPRRPDTAAVSGRLGIHLIPPGGATRTWSDVARWFAGLASTRVAPTVAMAAKVSEITAAGADPRRVIARFAQSDVRYVAIEIGIGGYQPHAAGDVFVKRYGDCKDKVTLLRAMLRLAGIDAYYVIVNTRRGTVDPAFPTIAAFNHVIAAIPVTNDEAKTLGATVDHPELGRLLLFDPTITRTPYGQLPAWLEGSHALLVTPDGGELIELPLSQAEASQLRRTAKLVLEPGGALAGKVEEVRTGSMAAEMRALLQGVDLSERIRTLESMVGQHLVGSAISGVEIDHLDDPEADLVIRYALRAPRYAKTVSGLLLVRPRVIGAKGESIIDAAARKYDYVTDGRAFHTDDVEMRVPAGVTLDELPSPMKIETPYVRYSATASFAEGVLRYRRTYLLDAVTVPRDHVGTLNETWGRILADERASAVFRNGE